MASVNEAVIGDGYVGQAFVATIAISSNTMQIGIFKAPLILTGINLSNSIGVMSGVAKNIIKSLTQNLTLSELFTIPGTFLVSLSDGIQVASSLIRGASHFIRTFLQNVTIQSTLTLPGGVKLVQLANNIGVITASTKTFIKLIAQNVTITSYPVPPLIQWIISIFDSIGINSTFMTSASNLLSVLLTQNITILSAINKFNGLSVYLFSAIDILTTPIMKTLIRGIASLLQITSLATVIKNGIQTFIVNLSDGINVLSSIIATLIAPKITIFLPPFNIVIQYLVMHSLSTRAISSIKTSYHNMVVNSFTIKILNTATITFNRSKTATTIVKQSKGVVNYIRNKITSTFK